MNDNSSFPGYVIYVKKADMILMKRIDKISSFRVQICFYIKQYLKKCVHIRVINIHQNTSNILQCHNAFTITALTFK